MDKVALEGLEFYAYHGYFEEEQKIGNKFNVDIILAYHLEKAAMEDQLSETIDYSQVYKIVAREMAKPARLLETVARRIITAVFEEFSEVFSVKIHLSKENPPVGGICSRAKVTLKREKTG